MNFLQSKGVRVEMVRPMMGNINSRELNPESYHLFVGDDEQWITLDTTNEMLYMHAREIDPDDAEEVFEHLRSMRNRINWLI